MKNFNFLLMAICIFSTAIIFAQTQQTGIVGNTVYLNDLENHSWSYYSDPNNPIHSLNPADIKITYNGNGIGTVTNSNESGENPTSFSLNSTTAQVGLNDPANVFVYYKTLERENIDGTGNLPYTTIPNPFLIRPTRNGSTETITLPYAIVYLDWNCDGWGNKEASVSYEYTDTNNQKQTITQNSNGSATIYVKVNTTITLKAKGYRSRSFFGGTRNYYPIITAQCNGSTIGTLRATQTDKEDNSTTSIVSATVQINTIYRGFYAWRVKNLSSGLTIKDAESSTSYAVGDIIFAERNILFVTSNEYGNEVEFEALWAQAYVTDGTSDLSIYSNSYERNFHVVKSSTAATNYQKNYPLTITALYPDGTNGGGSITGKFTATADTKFENINITGNENFTAAGHDLIFGRGVISDVGTIQGFTNNITNPNYTIRIESGTINKLYFTKSTNSTITGTVDIIGILGCDYDRAKNNNSLLEFESAIYYGTSVTISNDSNRNRKTLDLTIKSGKFNTDLNNDMGNADADESIYMSISSVQTNVGERRLTIEGGELANIAGGIDKDNQGENNNGTRSLTLYMKGGIVKGAIYGGAAKSPASGDRRMIFTGGTVGGWIATGCNGTENDGGQTYGRSYLYIGGNTSVGGYTDNINGCASGNVFAAGKGCASTNNGTSGEMTFGSNIVIADSAYISKDVYGGGYYGYAKNTTNVYILGGTINGSVFGGALLKQGPVINLQMKAGSIKGSLYGGSNENGTISGPITINIIGGNIEGNVLGGGYGSQTRVDGNITVTIGDENSTLIPTIKGDVYGGSEQGIVNGTSYSNNKFTKVIINKGRINNVYGGGYGTNTNAANVYGNVTVSVNGGYINNIFGCNNINGAPQGSVIVDINGSDTINNVYGGGNLADYTYSNGPEVNINGGFILNSVYGGGLVANVNKTKVNITGGYVNNSVFAGAEGNNKDITLVSGNKTVNMLNGTVGNLYGGSYTSLDKAYSFVNITGGTILSNVFGSGYFGNMDGNCYIYIGENAVLNAPHNTENTDKNTNNINALHIKGNIYAGANWGTYTGTFGEHTITGESNIFIDGKGYNMEENISDNFMVIEGSIYGCGTSCYAGIEDNSIIIRNYGQMSTGNYISRFLYSIQQCRSLNIDASSIIFEGQTDIASTQSTTIKYGIYNVDTIRIANNSNIALAKPLDHVKKVGSYTCANTYALNPIYNKINIGTEGNELSHTNYNSILILDGGYFMVRYPEGYNKVFGELEGFFYMQEPTSADGINNEGYFFARPKLISVSGQNNYEKDVHVEDGGFVDFNTNSHKNTFDINGIFSHSAGVQIPYTNQIKNINENNDSNYRFWRYRVNEVAVSTRDIMLIAKVNPNLTTGASSDAFITTISTTILPPAATKMPRYHISEIYWGTSKDCYNVNGTMNAHGNWIMFDENEAIKTPNNDELDYIKDEYYINPNNNFGLLIDFGGSFNHVDGDEIIICNESYDKYLATEALQSIDTTKTNELPTLSFLLTYSNRINLNTQGTGVIITLEEYDSTNTLQQIVYLYLDIVTQTAMGQDMEAFVFAKVGDDNVCEYTTQIKLPTFALKDIYNVSTNFNITNTQNNLQNNAIAIANWNQIEGSTNIALRLNAAQGIDDGWISCGNTNNLHEVVYHDFNNLSSNNLVGQADGRKSPIVDFTLQYDASKLKEHFTNGQYYLGNLTISLATDNIENCQNFDITVHVYVTGDPKFFYLDAEGGRDGNSGMFPDEAKKSLSSIVQTNGFTSNDIIFVINEVTTEPNSTLTWDGSKLEKVNVYRYPGGHMLKDGSQDENEVYTGKILHIIDNSAFVMNNIYLSGSRDIQDNVNFNPNNQEITSSEPLITIANNSEVSIYNSSLVHNNNTSHSFSAAIYNEGTLNIDGVVIENNSSNEVGTGIYQNGIMNISNTLQTIINDEVYLPDTRIMTALNGYLTPDSQINNIRVEGGTDTSYSGRVILRHFNTNPTSMRYRRKANAIRANLTLNQIHTDAEFLLANADDIEYIPYITYGMKEIYSPLPTDIIMVSPNANLPIELIAFNSTCFGNTIQLSWATATETNNEYFTIERSFDAINFTEVARISGAGTSTNVKHYTYIVENTSDDIVYYRLRQTDIDGKSEVFQPIAVQCSIDTEIIDINVYPQPANEMLHVVSNVEMYQISLFNTMGALIKEQDVNSLQTTINIASLESGIYLLRIITNDGQTINKKIIKK